MKNLIGVGVADAAEQMRIGQRALQRVTLLLKGGCECRGIACRHFEPARVERRQRGFSLHDVQRRALLRRRFSQKQSAMREVEPRKPDSPRDGGAAFAPLEPAGDHQVKHEEQLSLELPDDALADTSESGYDPSFSQVERRLDRSKQKGSSQPYALERMTRDARAER